MNDCPKKNWILFGCKFEARYDLKKEHGLLPHIKNCHDSLVDVINACKNESKTYVCDVCVRCGETIKRP